MEHAQSLIRMVVRSFYDVKHVLIIDALMLHSALWVDDLALVLSMTTKDLRKLLSGLKEDKLISVQSRQELREGQTRPQNKEYYYINYHLAIDAIKLRIVRLEKKVRDLYKPSQERKDYRCQQCSAQWAEMEVLSKADFKTGEFSCPRCGHELKRNEVSAEDRAGSQRASRLMLQLDRLVGSEGVLRQIDEVEIPQNDFDKAMDQQRPIDRGNMNPAVKWELFKKEQTSEVVRGIKVEAPEVQVSFTTEQETAKAEAEKKKQRLAQQEKNALPTWYTASTVTGQKTLLGDQEEARIKSIKDNLGTGIADDEAETKPAADDNEYISQYYRELEEARAAEQAQPVDEDGEDDDDDDEFEDVVPGGTPASAVSTNGVGSKRKADDSDTGSGINTAASTPAFMDSPNKRIKVEETTVEDAGDGEDDEEEDDFEDVV